MKRTCENRYCGFTLVELLVVIGIIGILAAGVIVAINPARQFASSRDATRRSDLYSISNAVYQYAVEHNGQIPGEIPSSQTNLGTGGGLVDLTNELVPKYLQAIPDDPTTGSTTDTGYSISQDTNGRVSASASSELNPGQYIQITR